MMPLDIERLSRKTQPPDLFAVQEKSFWQDPYISQKLLDMHLNSDIEGASRGPDVIKKTADWIVSLKPKKKGTSILDLGCGPGLYCEEFYLRALEVTGIDFSPTSIAYAKENIVKKQMNIRYECDDYLNFDIDDEFDFITLIYGGLCDFSQAEADILLSRIHRALKDDGYLIFDVYTERHIQKLGIGRYWYISLNEGFWEKAPHLVLEERLNFEDENVYLRQFTVIDKAGDMKSHHIWGRYYNIISIRDLLEKHKFKVVEVYSDLLGTPYQKNGEWIGLVVHKERR